MQTDTMRTSTETSFIDVAGKSTQLTRGGTGPALLYLHSAGGETEWTAFHDLLAQHFTVYLPAHPGFDNSDGLDEIDGIDDYAWHYVDLLEKLQLGPVPVVGFSLGGWIGMELAVLRPELVSQLLLVNTAGFRVPDAPMAELFLDDLDKLRNLLFFDPNGPAVAASMPSSYEDSRILLWLKAREATARVGWNPYLHNPKLARHLHRIGCPVKILWGRQDRLLPLPIGETLVNEIPQASLEIFEETGHMLPFEQSEKFVAAVQEFVQ